jgi:lysophospholipase
MNRLGQLLCFTLFSFSMAAFAVSESQYQRIYELVDNGRGHFYQHYQFTGVKNIKIVFTKFGTAQGSKGSLVISPGRTEDSLKYVETAYDFIQAGYSPVYVINHRGQGFSGRMLPDPQKGHVDDYVDYAQDFARFMSFVLADPNVDKARLFAVAHSLGGAVVTDYTMNGASPFKAVAMSAPLFKIPNDTEENLLRDTALACYVQFACNNYIPDGKPFTWQDRQFSTNTVTHSRVRFDYRDHTWRQWPALQLGDPTIRWVRETVQANIKRRDITRLKNVKSPFLIFMAEQEMVVDSSGYAPICQRMQPGKCKIEKVLGSRHEMLMEIDAIRTPVVNRILQFFANN